VFVGRKVTRQGGPLEKIHEKIGILQYRDMAAFVADVTAMLQRIMKDAGAKSDSGKAAQNLLSYFKAKVNASPRGRR
jgi:hypothetical protein